MKVCFGYVSFELEQSDDGVVLTVTNNRYNHESETKVLLKPEELKVLSYALEQYS